MSIEQQTIEYKSIQKIRNGDSGFKSLATTCVAFANAQGGSIYIGYEDKTQQAPLGQVIDLGEINDALTKLRSRCFNVAFVASEILYDECGSQYFILRILPSSKAIATTSDGKIYIRIADKCEPVRGEDIHRLCDEKGTYQWEIIRTRVTVSDIPSANIKKFANEIRSSSRVKEHVQQKEDIEIAQHYSLIDESQHLTHLGVLWLGNSMQRGRLSYPITVQYIVYDNLERKVRKEVWQDNTLDPKTLLLEIEEKAIELTYSYEFPEGLFRKQIRHYNPKLIRELLVNAFAHKSFTISSDIMIEVFPDRLEITNAGGLPLGITKDNILHMRHRRNPHLINIMIALKLMEGEGSGYDLIYELNSMEAKGQPVIISNFNEITVIQEAKIIDVEILPLLDYVLQNFNLTQKSIIAFGLIATEKKILSAKLSSILQLSENDRRMGSYTRQLLTDAIICKKGTGKGTQLYVNPKLISNSKAVIKTSLKTIEPYALKALIIEDVKNYPRSLKAEIAERLPDVDKQEMQKMIYSMVDKELVTDGGRTYRRYSLKE